MNPIDTLMKIRENGTCGKCRKADHSVKFDRHADMYLCNPCWFATDPKIGLDRSKER